jgi:hypothetical protein
MSETLTETFARFAEEADFRQWNEGRTVYWQLVLCSPRQQCLEIYDGRMVEIR